MGEGAERVPAAPPSLPRRPSLARGAPIAARARFLTPPRPMVSALPLPPCTRSPSCSHCPLSPPPFCTAGEWPQGSARGRAATLTAATPTTPRVNGNLSRTPSPAPSARGPPAPARRGPARRTYFGLGSRGVKRPASTEPIAFDEQVEQEVATPFAIRSIDEIWGVRFDRWHISRCLHR